MRRADARVAGFTLLEVMIALLLAMVGLLGTVAVQQSVLSATANVGDAAIATRLASAGLEQLTARRTLGPTMDEMAALANGAWSAPQILEASGAVVATATPAARFRRRMRVTNLGVNQPYNLSVEVSFALDTGRPKLVRLDLERRKSW